MLLFELALAWGCSIEEVGRRIGSREWQRWKLFYRLRPFGEAGADLRAGVMTAGIVNAIRRKNSAVPIDYMPVIVNLEGGPEKVRMERMKQKAKALADRYKRKV